MGNSGSNNMTEVFAATNNLRTHQLLGATPSSPDKSYDEREEARALGGSTVPSTASKYGASGGLAAWYLVLFPRDPRVVLVLVPVLFS